MYPYKVLYFDRGTGTYTVDFLDIEDVALNYNAPRKNGVYLTGQELEDAIQLLRKPFEELNEEELAIRFPTDDPATVTGGEEIEAKVEVFPPDTGMLVGAEAEAYFRNLGQLT